VIARLDVDDLAELVTALSYPSGGLSRNEAAAVIAARLRSATVHVLVPRAIIQALIPGILALARCLDGTAGPWCDLDTFFGDAISCLFEQITTWSGTLRPYAAGDLLSGVRTKLRTLGVSEARHRTRRLDTSDGLEALPGSIGPSGQELLAASITEAAGDGLAASDAAVLYANQRLGTHAIANWLRAAGLSTRAGKPWTHKAVLTVLRNRTYLGEVHFLGTWSKGTHPALVEHGLFDGVQAILAERGQDVSKRASSSSDYLLTGLVVCGGCGCHFTGTRATGRNATYRYDTCGGRQRNGTKTCSSDRLPAGALDDAVVRSLLAAYEDTDLFANAVAEAQGRALLGHRRHEGELRALDAELAKVDAGIDRYLRAFETGAMPESICGERVKALGSQSTALRARREVLAQELDEADLTAPTTEELSALRDRVAEAIATGDPAPVKILLQSLIHEIPGRQPRGHPADLPCSCGCEPLWARCGSRTVRVGGR
jgi:hypothetical protein